MLDRISDFVLTIFGVLVLALLILGLSTSCLRQADGELTPTPILVTIAYPAPGTPGIASPTPTPFSVTLLPAASATPTPLPGVTTEGIVPPPLPTAAPTVPAAIATTAPMPTAPLPTAAPGIGGQLTPGATIRHQVIQGEWLIQIARCYGTTYAAIHGANALPNPNLIYPGDVITVPAIGSIGRIVGPPCVQRYTVVAGDTWESLATRFATTTTILQLANPGALTTGRQIWAPRMQ